MTEGFTGPTDLPEVLCSAGFSRGSFGEVQSVCSTSEQDLSPGSWTT